MTRVALVMMVLLLVAACGGPPREARIALEETAGGLVVADGLVAAAVASQGEEARARVRREVRDGTISGETPEETIAAGLARFEELLQGLTTARRVLRTTRAALQSVELALDAWAAGSSDEGGFFAAAACGLRSLAELTRALEAAAIEIPEAIASGVRTLAGFASGACPAEGG